MIKTGILKIKDPDAYTKLMGLLDHVIYGNVDPSKAPYYPYNESFPIFLEQALEHNPNSSASVLYLGDRINDQVGNDLYVLDLTNLLSEVGVEYRILASNHDLEAVRGYLQLKDSADWKRIIANVVNGVKQEFVHTKFPGFTSCMKTLHERPDYYARYQSGMENYLQHMVVYGFNHTTGLLCGHTPPSERSINEIALQAGIDIPTEVDLGTKVGMINWWLKDTVLQNISNFQKFYPDLPNVNYKEYPLYTATSGTGCACEACDDGRGQWGVSGKKNEIVKYQMPTGAYHVEHGHIHTPAHETGLRADGTTIITLDSDFGCDPTGADSNQPRLHKIFGNHKVGLSMREKTDTQDKQ